MKHITINYKVFNKLEADEYLEYFNGIENVEIKKRLSFGISEQLGETIQVFIPAAAGLIASLTAFFKIYFGRNKGKSIKVVNGEKIIELKGCSDTQMEKVLDILENNND